MKQKPTVLNYILPLLMIGLGVRHYFKHGMDLVAIIPVVLGVFALYMALFNHALLHRVLNLITRLWLPVGQLITMILLSVTFFIVFAPVGLILRLLKKDILNKDFKVERITYWIDRPGKQSSHYTQQF